MPLPPHGLRQPLGCLAFVAKCSPSLLAPPLGRREPSRAILNYRTLHRSVLRHPPLELCVWRHAPAMKFRRTRGCRCIGRRPHLRNFIRIFRAHEKMIPKSRMRRNSKMRLWCGRNLTHAVKLFSRCKSAGMGAGIGAGIGALCLKRIERERAGQLCSGSRSCPKDRAWRTPCCTSLPIAQRLAKLPKGQGMAHTMLHFTVNCAAAREAA